MDFQIQGFDAETVPQDPLPEDSDPVVAWANLVEAEVTKLLGLHKYNPSNVCVIISVPIAEDASEAVLLR